MPGWKGQSYPSNASHIFFLGLLTWWHKTTSSESRCLQGCTSSKGSGGEPSVPPAPGPCPCQVFSSMCLPLCVLLRTLVTGLRTHLDHPGCLTWRSLIIFANTLFIQIKPHPQVPGVRTQAQLWQGERSHHSPFNPLPCCQDFTSPHPGWGSQTYIQRTPDPSDWDTVKGQSRWLDR